MGAPANINPNDYATKPSFGDENIDVEVEFTTDNDEEVND